MLAFDGRVGNVLGGGVLVTRILSGVLLPTFCAGFQGHLSVRLYSCVLVLGSTSGPAGRGLVSAYGSVTVCGYFRFRLLGVVFAISYVVSGL